MQHHDLSRAGQHGRLDHACDIAARSNGTDSLAISVIDYVPDFQIDAVEGRGRLVTSKESGGKTTIVRLSDEERDCLKELVNAGKNPAQKLLKA